MNPTNEHREQARENELLPCPFCGATAGDIPLRRGHGVIVGCSACQAQQFATERGEAIKLWNQRTLSSRDAEVREVLEGLSSLRRYTHGQPERCWCDAEDPETPHMPACLAARDLYSKLQAPELQEEKGE